MNSRLSALDHFAMVSNSDAHSPQKLAREATCFDTELSYPAMYTALKERDQQRFTGTLEFYPEEGKYHYDGHRKCQVRWKPGQTLQAAGRCPRCGGKLTVGVLHRVERLADRPEEASPPVQRPCEYIIPLPEVVGAALGVGPESKKATTVYARLLEQFGPELGILRTVPPEDVARGGEPLVAEALHRMRTGAVDIQAGYDGEYGTIQIFSAAERERLRGQSTLFVLPGPAVALTPQEESCKTALSTVARPSQQPGRTGAADVDTAQRQAVEAETGPVVVVAGPGTGKTRTLTQRIVHLMRHKGVPSTQILAVTFTRRAAAEMHRRLRELLSAGEAETLRIGTFHRLALDLMRLYDATPPRTILDAWEARQLLDTALRQAGLEGRPQTVQHAISLAKAAGLRPADLAGKAALQAAYTAYQAQLNAYQACDYDDILLDFLAWLDADGDTAEQLRQRFPYLLVDEFQDVNAVQYRLVKALAGDGRGLFVIGDPDQAIYGFRGADPGYFHALRQDFPLVRMYQLATNYRSTQTIVRAAAAVIAANRDRQPLSLHAVGAEGQPLRLCTAPSELAEGIAVVRQISRMVGGADMVQADQHATRTEHARSFSDFGVLVRTGQQAEILEQCFVQEGLPYRLIGQKSFLDARSVRQVLAFGRYIVYPEDRLRLLQVLEVAAFHPGQTALAEVRLQVQRDASSPMLRTVAQAVPAAASQLQALAAAVERYRPLVAQPAVVFLQRWQVEYGGAGDVDMERLLRLAERTTTLQELLDTILLGQEADYEYTSAQGGASVEAVKLLTLHAAKGLEFPVVFICGVEEGLLPVQAAEADGAEERRLFYVGLTRAREEVVLLRARARQRHGQRQHPALSPFVHDIPAALLGQEEVELPRQEPSANQLSLF
jgi:superfamily I DNA/RNA helicase